MEHITTKDAVDYVIQGGPNIAATVTTHHLIINRNAYLAGGIRPHYYCLPVAKRETCLLYTSPSPRDPKTSRMPSSA